LEFACDVTSNNIRVVTTSDALGMLDKSANSAQQLGVEVSVRWSVVQAAFPQRRFRERSLAEWAKSKRVQAIPVGLFGRHILLVSENAEPVWTFSSVIDSYAQFLTALSNRRAKSKDGCGRLLLFLWWAWMGLPVLAGWLLGVTIAISIPVWLGLLFLRLLGWTPVEH
jgi:hypothetical protein